MTAPDKLAAMKILSSIFSAAFQASPQLFPLIVCQQVNLSIQYGNTSLSAFAYSTYALILCGIAGDIDSGYQFGKLALRLLERINAKDVKTRTMQIVYSFIIHWQEPLRTTVQPLQSAYQIGLETGDIEYAAYCGAVYCLHLFFSGKELDQLEQDMATYTDAIARLKQETALNYHQVYQQLILNLLGKSNNSCLLIGEAYNESMMLPIHQNLNDKTALYYLHFNKSFLSYLFCEYHQAAHDIAIAEHYLDGVTATINIPLFYFYDSLIKLALYRELPKLEQDEILLKVAANQEKMEKWAQYAPMNYRHKFNLVEAERYRVLNQNLEAMDYYDRAIAGAKDNAYLNEEALAHELAAKFYLTWGKQIVAQTYLMNAYYAYARWGAKAKVEDLEQRYPQFLASILNREKRLKTGETIIQMTRGTIASTSSGSSNILDLEAVIKASQAISGEIQLDRLLSTLMQVAIENAGASKGVLILSKNGNLAIEAATMAAGLTDKAAQTPDKSDTKLTSAVLQSIPIHTSQDIPVSVINYVWHTQETLVLNDTKIETRFATDPYIIGMQPKSILCIPIRNQGKALGLLYLENNLATGTFTPDRLEVLQILSSQAAISVENARLYANLAEYNRTLETKVAERTQELSQALESLQATQEELIQSEKMAALGQLVAGVAHEINTPLGAIRASAGNVSAFLTQTLEELPELFKSLPSEHSADFSALLQSSLRKESILSLKEERKLKRILIRQLEAEGIEHAYTVADTLVDMGVYENIEPFLSLLRRIDSKHIVRVASNISGLQRGIQTINTAIERVSKVVFALKTYARYDTSSAMKLTHLIEGIETVLTLYKSQLKRGVEVKRNYGELPLVLCYPDELNQVWTNLIHNALQAMDYRGILTLDASQEQQQVKISITDSGKGIPEEIQLKIFDAFFTTKTSGEGSGLGLHIVKKIVEKHNGKITFKSQPGQTTFNVFLPIEPIE
ncbi:MAG TPA: ATP-binding protein [Allocoleopsis sp.]